MTATYGWISIALTSILAAPWAIFAAPLTQPAASEILPRYSLPVGRQLTYKTQSKFSYEGGSLRTDVTTQITVLSQNADGSSHLLVRTAERDTQIAGDSRRTSPEDVSYLLLDLSSTGRATFSSENLTDEAPRELPPLPVTPSDARTGWTQDARLPGENTRYSISDSDDDQWTLKEEDGGAFTKIYGVSQQTAAQFDASRGVVTTLKGATTQTYGFNGHGSDKTSLDSDATIPPDQLQSLAKDATTFANALQGYHNKIREIERMPENADALAKDAKAILQTAQVDSPEMKKQLVQLLKESDTQLQGNIQEAHDSAALLGKPAPAIVAKEMDGKPFDLASLRGNVVVLDFWYRGCGWCIRAMPQMNQLVDDMQGKPVIIVGVNVDQQPEDAKFVVDAMQVKGLTVLSNFDLAGKYFVRGFPTMVLIDQQGNVRKVHTSFSMRLKDELEKQIADLLAGEKNK